MLESAVLDGIADLVVGTRNLHADDPDWTSAGRERARQSAAPLSVL